MTTETSLNEISFADRKIEEASKAVADHMALMSRLQQSGIDLPGAKERLRDLRSDLRQWKEFKTLAMIRRGMMLQSQPPCRFGRAVEVAKGSVIQVK